MRTIPIQELVAKMSNGIYHSTSIERYRDIRDEGQILPGNMVAHKNFPQSEASNCHELGSVACFDFERADPSMVFGEDAMMKWPGVLLSHRFSEFPTTILIGFRRTDLPLKPLYYAEIKKRLGYGGIIPYGIECCYPGRMDLALSRHLIVVCHWNQSVLDYVALDISLITDDALTEIGARHRESAERYRRALRREV